MHAYTGVGATWALFPLSNTPPPVVFVLVQEQVLAIILHNSQYQLVDQVTRWWVSIYIYLLSPCLDGIDLDSN